MRPLLAFHTWFPLLLGFSLLPSIARSEERPFLFAEDARTPDQGSVDAIYRVTWGVSPGGAIRPIGSAMIGETGSVHEISAEVGVLPRLSLRAYGLGQIALDTGSTEMTGGAEIRARVIGSALGNYQVTLGAGALREFSGSAALQARIVASGTVGRFRLTADTLFEHSLRPVADALDIIVAAGASYAVLPYLRAGIEYIGQDIEAAVDPDEVEGSRHLLGPTLALNLLEQRLQIVGGPSFGLTPTSPHFVVRIGVTGTL